MNQIPYGTIIKDNNGQRWILLSSKWEEISENYQVYETLDNGGRPFDVIITYNKIYILNNESKDLFILNNYSQIFIGKDPKYPMYDGNSILVHLNDQNYIFIGDEIYSFQTDSPILEYHSPVGNNDVPYPYAVSRNKIYLMIYHITIPYTNKEDPYENEERGILFKYNVIQERPRGVGSLLDIWQIGTAPYRS